MSRPVALLSSISKSSVIYLYYGRDNIRYAEATEMIVLFTWQWRLNCRRLSDAHYSLAMHLSHLASCASDMLIEELALQHS